MLCFNTQQPMWVLLVRLYLHYSDLRQQILLRGKEYLWVLLNRLSLDSFQHSFLMVNVNCQKPLLSEQGKIIIKLTSFASWDRSDGGSVSSRQFAPPIIL